MCLVRAFRRFALVQGGDAAGGLPLQEHPLHASLNRHLYMSRLHDLRRHRSMCQCTRSFSGIGNPWRNRATRSSRSSAVSECSMCVLILLYICVLILLLYVSSYYYMCPHTMTEPRGPLAPLLFECYMCVLILLYKCPHNTVYVSS